MKAILRNGFLALAIIALAVPADAGPYEDGMVAYEREDYATALKFFRPLAEQGLAAAQYNLGQMYHFGRGVAQDDAAAVKWYRKAAEQGHVEAQNNLGVFYAVGKGVPQNYVSAHMWFNLAAAHGYGNAQASRKKVAEDMSPDQIAEAQHMDREWMAKHPQ